MCFFYLYSDIQKKEHLKTDEQTPFLSKISEKYDISSYISIFQILVMNVSYNSR